MSGVYEDTETGERATIRLGGLERSVLACHDHPFIRSHRAGPAFEADIVSTWRDAPGEDVTAGSGIQMEIRRENGTVIQTISGRAPKGVPLDLSYEIGGDGKSGLPRLRTNVQLFGDDGALPVRTRLRLRTELFRRVIPVTYGESTLSVTMETGRVFAWPEDGRFLSRRIGQIIMNLDIGKKEDLAAFARDLSAHMALYPDSQTPEDIARSLLREDMAMPVKAPRYDLPDGTSAGDVLEAVLGSVTDQILGNIPAVRAADPTGIKQMRIGLRRFRSVAKLFSKSLPAEVTGALADQAKTFGQILGDCRDLDVFLDETLPAIHDAGLAGLEELSALEALGRQAEALRDNDRRVVARMIDDDTAFSGFCTTLSLMLQEAPWQHDNRLQKPAEKFAGKALDKALAKGMATGESLAEAPPHARHPLRVELKKLRYAVQAFRPLYAKDRRKPYMAAMSGLQDAFGTLNDGVVARDVAIRVAASVGAEDPLHLEAGAGYVIGWTQRGLTGQGDEVLDAWKEFAGMTPFWRKEA